MVSKIKEYELIVKWSIEEFGDTVSKKIPEWQPYGSPYLNKDGRHCQAMVRYAEDTPDGDGGGEHFT